MENEAKKVIDMELNEDGVAEKKEWFGKRLVNDVKADPKKYMLKVFKAGTYIGIGVILGHFDPLHFFNDVVTDPEAVAEVAETVAETVIK